MPLCSSQLQKKKSKAEAAFPVEDSEREIAFSDVNDDEQGRVRMSTMTRVKISIKSMEKKKRSAGLPSHLKIAFNENMDQSKNQGNVPQDHQLVVI